MSGAVLSLRRDRGIMAPISDSGFAGRSARALLPAAMIIPLLLGWLRLLGERAALFPSEVGVALMITATVMVLVGLTWLNSRSLLAVDRKRATAEQALRALNDRLEARVKERADEIAQTERFLAAVLANMQDAMIVSRGGRIVFANEAAMRLVGATTIEQVLDRRTLDFIDPELHVLAAERGKTLLARPAQLPVVEERLVRLDGSRVDVEVASASFADGSEIVIIAMIRDLTQRKLIERQLQHALRMDAIGQLTGGIAHDFNNLLVVITGNLDLLEGVLADNPRVLAYAQMASKAAWRGAELTRQLLAFSRKQTLEPKVIDINAIVGDTASLLRRTIGEQIDLRLELAGDLWPAFVDKTQLESALTNLAINARDAMPQGGKLIFETANKQLDASFGTEGEEVAPGDYVMIAVSDTGTGIPAEIVARVFEPFFTTKGEGKGTGLGLAMIYGFVKQSRGHVRIYSEVGHGTTVRLYLPRGEGAPSQVTDAPFESLMAPRDTKVLVVEDNADVRHVAVGQLTEYGYHVIEAENGPAAMDILKRGGQIDLLFSDAIMPGGMTGMQLAEEATKLRRGIKVLLTSGFAEASLNTARAAAGIPLISKPYRKQDLARKVREVLSVPAP
jgi:PAS domain S-box-containing protein